MRLTKGDKIFGVINAIVLIFLALTWTLPLLHVVAQSLSNTTIVSAREVLLFPVEFTLVNYEEVFGESSIISGFAISGSRTLIGATVVVFFNAMVSYALSKTHLVFRRGITIMVLITMYFGGGLIPTYVLVNNLGLIDTFSVYIIPFIYSGTTIIIMRTFFKAVPGELEESAKIDGANDWTIFSRIYLPLSKALLATMFLFSAVWHWNDWFIGEIYVQSQELKPISTVLMQIVLRNSITMSMAAELGSTIANPLSDQASSTGVEMAAVVVATLPILIVYPFLQKHFSKGVMIGSLKG